MLAIRWSCAMSPISITTSLTIRILRNLVTIGEGFANVEYPGLIIRYTTDGTEPARNSLRYEGPVQVQGNVRLRAFDLAGNGSRAISVK